MFGAASLPEAIVWRRAHPWPWMGQSTIPGLESSSAEAVEEEVEVDRREEDVAHQFARRVANDDGIPGLNQHALERVAKRGVQIDFDIQRAAFIEVADDDALGRRNERPESAAA